MDLEGELLKNMEDDGLEEAVASKIDSFHGLLTREAAIRLIAKEKGLLKKEERSFRLAEIPKGERKVGFKATVRRIWPVASYASGKRSRVVEVEDESGSMPLVLWNEDVELAARLRTKDEVHVQGAYERNGELHLGYSGSIKVMAKAGYGRLSELEEGESAHLRGFVAKIEGADSFVKGAQTVRGSSFIISDGSAERRCVILGAMERASKLQEGDEVIIENATVSNGNLEIGSESRLLSRRAKDMLIGELKGMECEGDRLVATIGERTIKLDRENALRFLGVEATEDIELCTIASLKRDALINSRMAVKVEQREGHILIR
ncbi:MAG: hypothetical protein AB1295_02455 [Candidatus Micrarchaeota archaeon]